MIKNKKIIITGVSGVIGRAIAERFANDGNRLILHYHSSIDKIETLKNKIGGADASVHFLSSDFSKIKNVESFIGRSLELLEGLDVLIHASSFFKRTPLGSISEVEWDKIIDLNLKATFFLTQSAGIVMQSEGGSIVLFSDVAGMRPYAGYLPYSISKAGIDALVKGLAKALAPKVLVNGIAPYVVTRHEGLSDKKWNDLLSKMPMHQPTRPEEIARLVELLCSNENSMTGQIISIDGGRLLR